MFSGIRGGRQCGGEGLKRVQDCSCHRKTDKTNYFFALAWPTEQKQPVGGGRLQGNAQETPKIGAARDKCVTLCDCPATLFLPSESVYSTHGNRPFSKCDIIYSNLGCRPVNLRAFKPSSRPRKRPKRSFSRPVNVWMALPLHLVIHSFRTLILLHRSHTKAQGCSFGGNQGN